MKISVLLATYNQDNYIKGAIESILQNSYEDFELLVLDQSRNDFTKEVIQIYLKQSSKVKYIKLPFKGKSKALNYGVNISQGDIIAITDSDCIVDKDWLEK
ncbi:MAG: glycosyltransferase, partial [Candidatus Omnitrophica bacterium]|nr:glycosyltransferase [Candidatus Omnitrophota bacterium]